MEKVPEIKVDRCRYGEDVSLINEMQRFGWEVKERKVLNQNEVELKDISKYHEDELREKCLCDIVFMRSLDDSVKIKIAPLYREYTTITLLTGGFGKGRIILVSILSFLSIVLWLSFILTLDFIVFVPALILGLPIIPLMINGFRKMFRIRNENRKRREKRDELSKEAEAIFKSYEVR